MFSETDLKEWAQRLTLKDEALAEIEKIRSSEPSRRVASGRRSTSGRYPSRKMGRTIQFESGTNELPHIYKLEYDDDVLEYWDQPPPFFLDYLSKSGRRSYHQHTPDFFVIRSQSAGWEECKTEKELLQKAESSPNRWLQQDNRSWNCPPGEEYAQQFGLYYAVRSSAEINPIFVRNCHWLEDYYSASEILKVDDQIVFSVQELVKTEPGITLVEILHQLQQLSADDLNILIATRQIFVDLNDYVLARPEQVEVFSDEETYLSHKLVTCIKPSLALDIRKTTVEIGAVVSWDGEPWKIVNAGDKFVGLLHNSNHYENLPNNVFESLVQAGNISGLQENTDKVLQSEAEAIWRKASREDQGEALRRYKIIEPALNNGSSNQLTRNQRRWLASYLRSSKVYGNGFIGLIPNFRDRGWRRDGIEPKIQELLEQHIEEHYETIRQESIRHAYNSFAGQCKEKGYKPPSYEKYRQEVRARPLYKQIEKRMGERVAYEEEDFYWYLHREETPPHGERPFQVCHIDHTEVPVELRSEIMLRLGFAPSMNEDKTNMKKAWVTILKDAYDRRILAVYMTFDPPSYRSIMMVLRICVQRHKRLPKTIVTDGGAEFSSTYYEVLLAYFGITKKQRPKSKPRHGSVIENFFGISDKEFWYNLMGNTQIMKRVRQVTKNVNPRNNATWTLIRLYIFFAEYCYEIHEVSPHPALRMSPRDAYKIGIARGGLRSHTFITPEEFNFKSLPSPRDQDGKRKITNKGIKLHYFWYWHESFKRSRSTNVDVKYDPFDISVVYAYVKGEWVRCRPKRMWELEWLEGRSEKELMIATDELRRLNKLQNGSFINVTGQKLAEFFKRIEIAEDILSTSWREAKNKVAIQHLRDIERHFIHTLIEGNSIEPKIEHLSSLLDISIPLANELDAEKPDSTKDLSDAKLDDSDDGSNEVCYQIERRLKVW